MKKQVEDWLNAASDDLKVIARIIDDKTLTNMIAFHSQQAIEKTLKGVLEEYESRVPRIHSVIILMEMVKKYIPVSADKILLESINEIYADSRYPSDLGLIPKGKPSLKLAKSFYTFALEINNQVVKHFSKLEKSDELMR